MRQALAISVAALVVGVVFAPGRAHAEDPPLVGHVDAAPVGPSLEERFAEIRRRIQAALEYPPMARRRALEGETVVRFTIGSDLHARDVRVARTSGEKLLDDAAERAVVAAGALPYVHGPLEVPVLFELKDR